MEGLGHSPGSRRNFCISDDLFSLPEDQPLLHSGAPDPCLRLCCVYHVQPRARTDLADRLHIQPGPAFLTCPVSCSSRATPLPGAGPKPAAQHHGDMINMIISCFMAAFTPPAKEGSKGTFSRGEAKYTHGLLHDPELAVYADQDQGPDMRHGRPEGRRVNSRTANPHRIAY